MISNSLPFFHPYVSFFFFFFFFLSCILSATHIYHCPLVHHLLFLFLYFHFPEASSKKIFSLYFHLILEALWLSHFLLSFFSFFFPTWFHKFSSSLCDTWFHNLACLFGVIIFKVQTHTNTHGERRNRLCMQPGVISASFFFFLIIYCCSNFFFSVLDLLLLLFWF